MKQERHSTGYKGVYYIIAPAVGTGKPEKIFYLRYRRLGKLIEEVAGRQGRDDMTAARASAIRVKRLQGDTLSNKERRAKEKEAKAGKWTIARIWEEWLAVNGHLRGLKRETCRWDKHLKNKWGNKTPEEICTLDIDRWRVELTKTAKTTKEDGNVSTTVETYAPATVKNAMVQLRRILLFAKRRQLCEVPDITFNMPKVDNETTEVLTKEELDRLIKTLDAYHDQEAANFIRLALFTGMRKSELMKLQWVDVDLVKGFITIANPKGGKTARIPINSMARDVLESYTVKEGFVFPGAYGGARHEFTRPAREIKKLAGLPKDFRPLHGLRHVFASLMASSGKIDLYTLQHLLTHKSAAMTQRYAHLIDEALRRAADVGGDIFEGLGADNVVDFKVGEK